MVRTLHSLYRITTIHVFVGNFEVTPTSIHYTYSPARHSGWSNNFLSRFFTDADTRPYALPPPSYDEAMSQVIVRECPPMYSTGDHVNHASDEQQSGSVEVLSVNEANTSREEHVPKPV
jgi:hypothetical protein